MEQYSFATLCSSVVCNWMLWCCHCDTMLVMGPDWDNVSTKLWCCRVSALIRNITDGHRLCCGHFSSTPILLQICFSVLSSHNSHLRTRHLYLYDHRYSHCDGDVLCLFLLGLTKPYKALLGLTGPYWALLSLTWPYWALLGLTGPYWALLGLTGPY